MKGLCDKEYCLLAEMECYAGLLIKRVKHVLKTTFYIREECLTSETCKVQCAAMAQFNPESRPHVKIHHFSQTKPDEIKRCS